MTDSGTADTGQGRSDTWQYDRPPASGQQFPVGYDPDAAAGIAVGVLDNSEHSILQEHTVASMRALADAAPAQAVMTAAAAADTVMAVFFAAVSAYR